MEKNIEMVESGLVCDNAACDWIDPTVTFDNFKEWLNRPCPKCGENLLTQQDFDNATAVHVATSMINGLTAEQLTEMARIMGLPETDPNDPPVRMEINTHKTIKVDITP